MSIELKHIEIHDSEEDLHRGWDNPNCPVCHMTQISWQTAMEWNKTVSLDAAKTREIGKLTAEFRQIIGLLTACRDALHELRCYDADFYDRTCGGLIPAIESHLGFTKHEPETIHPGTP